MLRSWLVCTTALLLAPLAASAEVFSHGIGSEGYWTNNLFGSGADDEVDDGSVRVLPWAEVVDREGEVGWTLRYSPAYEQFFQESDFSGFDHDVLGSLRWRVGPRTSLTLTDNFRRTHTIARFDDATQPGEDLLLQSRRDRVKSNWLSGQLEHSLTPIDFLSFSSSFSFQDLSQKDSTDSQFIGSNMLYRRQLSERTSLGTRFSFSRQTSKPGERRDEDDPNPTQQQLLLSEDRDTDFYNLSAVLEYAFSPTLHLSLSAGPALIVGEETEPFASDVTATRVVAFPLIESGGGVFYVDPSTCPKYRGNPFYGAGCRPFRGAPALNDEQEFTSNLATSVVPVFGAFTALDNENTTYFADATLSKEWQRWTGQLTYRRSEDRTSSFGAISDVLFGRLRWQLTPALSTSLLVSYEQRTQASEAQTTIQLLDPCDVPTSCDPPLVAYGPGTGTRVTSLERVTLENELSLDVTSLYWNVNYQLAQRTELYSIVAYRDEAPQEAASAVLRDVNRFSVTVGVRYSFTPIPF